MPETTTHQDSLTDFTNINNDFMALASIPSWQTYIYQHYAEIFSHQNNSFDGSWIRQIYSNYLNAAAAAVAVSTASNGIFPSGSGNILSQENKSKDFPRFCHKNFY